MKEISKANNNRTKKVEYKNNNMKSNYEEKKDSDGDMGRLNNGKPTDEVEKQKPKQMIVDGNWVSIDMFFIINIYVTCISHLLCRR